MVVKVICSLTEKNYKFKAENKNLNFPTQFLLGSISEIFEVESQKKYNLREIFMIFNAIMTL